MGLSASALDHTMVNSVPFTSVPGICPHVDHDACKSWVV